MKIIHPESIPDWLIKEVQEYFVPLPFEPESILDIGANIGAFAQLALEHWPSTRIICCEPMPFNVTRLRHAVGSRATILSAAIRAHSGIDEIYLGDNLVTGGFVQLGRQTQHRIVVECLAAHELPSCELVKVDTEGCELEILMNLKLDQTRAIWVEYHSLADAQAIRGLLERDFELQRQVPNNAIGTMAFVRAYDPPR